MCRIACHIATFLALALGLAACQITPANLAPEQAARIRTLAIVSTVNDNWLWENKGFLAFARTRTVNKADWRLAERVRNVTRTALAKSYSLVPAPPGIDSPPSSTRSQGRQRLMDALARMAFRPDAVLLIEHGTYGTPRNVQNASSYMVGLGVYRTTHLFEEYVSLYTMLSFELIDGKTGVSLALFDAVMPNSAPFSGPSFGDDPLPFIFLNYPGERRIITTWTDSFDDQPVTSSNAVRAAFYDFIDKSIPFTLRKSGLLR